MSKINAAQAVKLGYTSQATLYRDMRTGKVSFERNGKDRRLIDISELTRVYGEPADTEKEIDRSQIQAQIDTDKEKIITILENQVTDLQAQIQAERTERQQLLEMLQGEQEKTRQLLLQAPIEKLPIWKRIFRLN